MKLNFLLFCTFLNISLLIAQKQVNIDGYILASPDPETLTLNGPRFKVYTSVEIWKLNTWEQFKKTNDSTKYSSFNSTRGLCTKSEDDNYVCTATFVTPGEYILRVVYNYNTPAKRKEFIKILDTRTEAQKNMKKNVYKEKKINVDGFQLTAIKPDSLVITEPTYKESLVLEIWEQNAWTNHNNNKNSKALPHYKWVSTGNSIPNRERSINVRPGVYVMTIELTNEKTGEFNIHQKVLNTEVNKPNEVIDDGFSIQFIPNK
jgi:hypothetical protein